MASVLLLLSACTGAAPAVEEVTIVNETAYDVEVEVGAAEGDGWLPLARVEARSTGSAHEVIDQSDVWVFRFRHWGEPVGEVTLRRGELDETGWSVEVPGDIAERLEDLERPRTNETRLHSAAYSPRRVARSRSLGRAIHHAPTLARSMEASVPRPRCRGF